jgi:ABC-type dipeptide/oligopeptide/nickel transport system permease subunit
MEQRVDILSSLWQGRTTRFCLIALLVYTIAAGIAEISYRRASYRHITPAYNLVREDLRYVPPAFVRPLMRQWTSPDPSLKRWQYPLGSDNLGRDVFLRLLQGTRIAFQVGIITSLIALPLGILLGCLGGYFGGVIDSLVIWLCATVASVPTLLLILAISMVAGKGLAGVTWGIGLTTWVSVCRSLRAEVIKHRGRTYVQAARLLGYGHARILIRHILPNTMHIVLVSLSIRFPAAVGTEVFISFLGIGVQGEPSWGIMLNNARLRLWQGIWWEMTFVTIAIFGLVLVFNVLADRLRDLLDPSLTE